MSDARKVLNALGGVDEKFIEEAAEPGPLRRKKPNWKVWGGCVAAAIAVAIGIGALSGGADKDVKTDLADTRQSIMVTTNTTSVTEAASAPAEAPALAESTAPMSREEEMAELIAANDAIIAELNDGLVLNSLDNAEYLEKCASSGLVAGAPEYPERAVNPEAAYDMNSPIADWDSYSAANDKYYAETREITDEVKGYEIPLRAFTETSAKEFLIGNEDNTVYSPLNVYMALSMLAELTDGDSRQQILDVLCLPDIDSVRDEARKLWLANYSNDGMTTLLLGTGSWISEELDVNQEVLETLVEKYYAFYVVGEMGSSEMDQSFRDWLSAQTMGLLDDFVSGEHFDPDTVLALASTIYYKAHWQDVFNDDNTEDAVFHAKDGDQTVPFMNEKRSGSISWGSNFTAAFKPMAGRQRMYFVLPDEGSTVDEVLANDQFWTMLSGSDDYENVKHGCIVTMSIPKFDVSSGANLIDGLRALGVEDVFSPDASDFSALTPQKGVFVGKVSHNARVKIDEEGVEAAAYTAMLLCGSSMPTDYVDFICDRPFIFAIQNYDGAVLFMGTVNSIK